MDVLFANARAIRSPDGVRSGGGKQRHLNTGCRDVFIIEHIMINSCPVREVCLLGSSLPTHLAAVSLGRDGTLEMYICGLAVFV